MDSDRNIKGRDIIASLMTREIQKRLIPEIERRIVRK
jgi:hypothetical protein